MSIIEFVFWPVDWIASLITVDWLGYIIAMFAVPAIVVSITRPIKKWVLNGAMSAPADDGRTQVAPPGAPTRGRVLEFITRPSPRRARKLARLQKAVNSGNVSAEKVREEILKKEAQRIRDLRAKLAASRLDYRLLTDDTLRDPVTRRTIERIVLRSRVSLLEQVALHVFAWVCIAALLYAVAAPIYCLVRLAGTLL